MQFIQLRKEVWKRMVVFRPANLGNERSAPYFSLHLRTRHVLCFAKTFSHIITKAVSLFLFLSPFTGPPDPPTNVNFHYAINRGESINVTWVLGQQNNSPIRKVIIQCTTQFYPDTWETIAEEYDPQKGWTQISLSPWLRYNFRVIATNDIGNSTPSAQTTSFQAPPAGGELQAFNRTLIDCGCSIDIDYLPKSRIFCYSIL